MVEKRMNSLNICFKKDPDLHNKYKECIKDYVRKGIASKVQHDSINEEKSQKKDVWYHPHHAVIHPQKPQKPIIVFDCAAQYEGVSLKKWLLQGPDMTKKLIGVLIRFWEESTAFMADIEAMFCQMQVSPEH